MASIPHQDNGTPEYTFLPRVSTLSNCVRVVVPCWSCPVMNGLLDQHMHHMEPPQHNFGGDSKSRQAALTDGRSFGKLRTAPLSPPRKGNCCWYSFLGITFLLNCGILHSCIVRRRVHYLYDVEEPSVCKECLYGIVCCPCSYTHSVDITSKIAQLDKDASKKAADAAASKSREPTAGAQQSTNAMK